VKPQRATSSPSPAHRSPGIALTATQTSCQLVH